MENPAAWKRAELVIIDALTDLDYMANSHMIGPSRPHLIAERLRAAGLLNDKDEPEIGWDGVRAHRVQTREYERERRGEPATEPASPATGGPGPGGTSPHPPAEPDHEAGN